MADIEKVKQGLKAHTDECAWVCNENCPYYEPSEYGCCDKLTADALSVIESQQAEIEQMKAQKQKWLQNIADQQLAVSPTGYETEEGLAKRTGEWNGLQMAWEILTKE